MMKIAVKVVIALLFTFALVAQETAKNVAELNSTEQLELRAAQVDWLQAQATKQAADRAENDAKTRLSELVNKVFTDRKISNADYILCDGPSQGITPCLGLKPHQLALKPQPKTKAEAKP